MIRKYAATFLVIAVIVGIFIYVSHEIPSAILNEGGLSNTFYVVIITIPILIILLGFALMIKRGRNK